MQKESDGPGSPDLSVGPRDESVYLLCDCLPCFAVTQICGQRIFMILVDSQRHRARIIGAEPREKGSEGILGLLSLQ